MVRAAWGLPDMPSNGRPCRPFTLAINCSSIRASSFTRCCPATGAAIPQPSRVPLVHAVDSEISDIVSAFDAGWVLDPDDDAAWQQVCIELGQPEVLARKTEGAVRCSHERFDPAVSLTDAGLALTETQTG